jgi:hypothetical protein
MMSNLNFSYSDEGNSTKHRLKDYNLDIIDRKSVGTGDKGFSLQMEYSEKGNKTNNYHYGRREERISEEEENDGDESDRHSTPPGTIGEAQDIMSENIESSLRKGGKKHGTVAAYHPKSLGPIFEDYGD